MSEDREIYRCSINQCSNEHNSRVAQGAYLEVEYIRNVLRYADSGIA